MPHTLQELSGMVAADNADAFYSWPEWRRLIVQFEEKLDVIEEDIVQYSQELLNIFLKDRTTKEGIIWATSDHISHADSVKPLGPN